MRRRDFYWSLYHLRERRQLDDLKTEQIEAIYAALSKSAHQEYLIWKDGFENWKPLGDFEQILVSLRRQGPEPAAKPPSPNANDLDTDPAVGNTARAPLARTEQSQTKSSSVRDTIRTLPESEDLTPTQPPDTESITAPLTEDDAEFTRTPRTGFDLNSQDSDPSIKVDGSGGMNSKRQVFDAHEINEPTQALSLDEEKLIEARMGARYDRRFEMRIVTPQKTYRYTTIDVSLSGIRFGGQVPEGLAKYFNVEIRHGDTVIPLVCSVLKIKGKAYPDRLRIEVNDQVKVLQTLLVATG
jgi:hypothetical protein